MAFEREIGLALAAGAVAAYPPARDAAKKGASIVVDTAGRAGNVVVGAGKGAYEGARSGMGSPASATATRSGNSSRSGSSSRRGGARSSGRRSSASRGTRSSSSKSGS